MASKINLGLWPLLMGLLEYFQNPSQTIHNDTISKSFELLGAALVSDNYFIELMVPGLWPPPETSDLPYHASNMHMFVVGVPQK